MDCTAMLTVWFDGQFWVGVYERRQNGRIQACRTVFGAEPKDAEIYQWLQAGWNRLRFGPQVPDGRTVKTENPKRMQRQIARMLRQTGTGARSQMALQAMREQSAQTRRADARGARDRERDRIRAQKIQKRKEKHRGR